MMGGRRFPQLVYLIRRMVYPRVSGDPEQASQTLLSTFPAEDQQIVERPEIMELMVAGIQEGYRQGWHGPAQDDILINSPWGFRLGEITIRVDIWQGELDKNVPLNQGQYQHEKIPNSRLTVIPGQAHLYLFDLWKEILANLVA